MLRALLAGAGVLGTLHVVVALPSLLAKAIRGSSIVPFPGVKNFGVVDANLWRGGAPSATGYRVLADTGVATVIDLRAESGASVEQAVGVATQLAIVRVPIRDGQTPDAVQIAEIAAKTTSGQGPVFIHCGAGVGRTGSVVAALRVANGLTPTAALVEALSFGPLSFEQQIYILTQPVGMGHLWPLVVAASRVVDSPRRLWSRCRQLFRSRSRLHARSVEYAWVVATRRVVCQVRVR
jgi:protein tyrosine phosphatase (PTP) superfamily phosphohydrolase (DUF442 family)